MVFLNSLGCTPCVTSSMKRICEAFLGFADDMRANWIFFGGIISPPKKSLPYAHYTHVIFSWKGPLLGNILIALSKKRINIKKGPLGLDTSDVANFTSRFYAKKFVQRHHQAFCIRWSETVKFSLSLIPLNLKVASREKGMNTSLHYIW